MKKIAIHSVPRSGSSWLGQILNSSPKVNFKFQPLFSYAFKDALDENSSRKEINAFFNDISLSNDNFLKQQDKIDSGSYPNFNKDDLFSHVIYKEVRYHHILENLLKQDKEIRIIGLIRNPFAVIHSFLKSPREFRKDLGWLELDEWKYAKKKNLNKKEEFYGYEKWKEVCILFNKLKTQYPDRFYLLAYDNLLSNTVDEVQKIFNFCEIDMTEQTLDFLDKSQSDNDETYSVYRKKSNDNAWIKTLDTQIVQGINNDLEINSLKKYME